MARERARTSPVRIRAAQVSASTIVDTALMAAAQKLASDHQALNFAGAFADGAELDVAIKLLGRIIFDEAVAAVNLHAFVGHADGDFAGIKFCHARFAREARAAAVG